MKTEEEQFFVEISKNEEENCERQQKYLKETGLVKQLIEFSITPDANNINCLKQMILNVVDSDCQGIISWARDIPDFKRLLIKEQTFLIEQNFLEIILIDYLWKSLSAMDGQLVLNEYLSLTRNQCKDTNLLSTFQHFNLILNQFRKLGITRDELVCFKVLALFKAYYGSNKSSDDIVKLREKCFVTLKKATQDSKSASDFKYDSYLMLLSDIKSLSMKFMSSLLASPVGEPSGSVCVPNLLLDMCSSHKSDLI